MPIKNRYGELHSEITEWRRDSCHMLQERPGAHVFLGNGDTAKGHHPAYGFDDEAIAAGASWYSGMIETWMPL